MEKKGREPYLLLCPSPQGGGKRNGKNERGKVQRETFTLGHESEKENPKGGGERSELSYLSSTGGEKERLSEEKDLTHRFL